MLITLHLPYYGKLLVYKIVQEFAHHGDFRCNGKGSVKELKQLVRVCETPAEMRVQKEPAGPEAAEEATRGPRSNCTNRKITLYKFDFHRVYQKPEALLNRSFH
jgi:hypothetical protein